MKNLNKIKATVAAIRERAEEIGNDRLIELVDYDFGAFKTMADLNEMPEAGYAAHNGATLLELETADRELLRLCNKITLSRHELKGGKQ